MLIRDHVWKYLAPTKTIGIKMAAVRRRLPRFMPPLAGGEEGEA
jgi:hypothetical protein